MSDSRPKRWRGGRVLIVALAAAYPMYLGATALVRRHVDRLIARNVGERVPAFALAELDGTVHTDAELRGRIAVLHFMSSHCPSCEQEKPAIRAFEAGLDPGEVVILSVLTDPVLGYDLEASRRTVERADFRHPIVLADAAFVDAFHDDRFARVTPITYVADRQGVIVATLRGTQTVEALRAALDPARRGGS